MDNRDVPQQAEAQTVVKSLGLRERTAPSDKTQVDTMKMLLNEPTGNGQTQSRLCIQAPQPNPNNPSQIQAGRPANHFSLLKIFLAAVLLAALGPARVAADVPMILHYQGTVQMSGSTYHGMGYFKFALINAAGTTTHWSNDDSSSGGSEPGNAVPIPVDNGYYSVLLGNTSLSGMTTNVPYRIFRENERVWLRIWFSHNTVTFEHLEPDQRIAAVGYAMVAQTVVAGGITASAIADGAVTAEKLAANAINSTVIPDDLELGDHFTSGSLKIWPEIPDYGSQYPTILLQGNSGKLALRGDVVSESAFNAVIGNPCSSMATPKSVATVRAETYGGLVVTYDENEVTSALVGTKTGAGGVVKLYQQSGQPGAELTGDEGGSDSGGQLTLYQHTANRLGIEMDADAGGSNGGGRLALYKGDGSTSSIVLRAEDDSGCGRITTQVLEITGGCDLSEQFNIRPCAGKVEPGMIVCIDAERPGELRVSARAYDPTVAGVVSGAGGVNPGMFMGQRGTVADGEHPVALTGRVYCQVDAGLGAIKPGDLITTSTTRGHGMKADPAKAAGAIIGKAMTPLKEGRGLVLVLVSLQ